MLAIHGDGEPLLGDDIDYYINVARENNIVLHMNSTGFFLNPDLTERFLRGSKLSIRFSIHAGSNQTYAKIMRHDFDTVKKKIKYLIDKNVEIGDTNNEFWFSYIVMKENIDEIPEFLYLANQLGIRQVRFMKLNPNRFTIRGVYRKEENFKFYHSEQFNEKIKKEFLKRLPDIKSLAKKLSISIEPGDLDFECRKTYLIDNVIIQRIFRKFWSIKPKGSCIAPWVGGCVIAQSGNVSICCASPYIIGNLFQHSFEEIWNSAKMQSVRQAFRSGKLLKSCYNCRTVRLEEYPKFVLREFKDKLGI
jgi:radical SAM protein with 4Fe4S-binding SPASM domain